MASYCVGAAIFIWAGKTVGWQGIKNALLIFASWQGMVIFGLTLLIMLVSNWRWQEVLRGEGITIPYLPLLGTYLGGFAVMYLAPILVWGGEFFRGYVLKEKNGVPWSKAMASIIIDRTLEWTFNLSIVLIGILFFIYKIGLPSSKLLIIIGGGLLVIFFAICFFYFKAIKKESIAKAIGKIFIRGIDSQPLATEKEIFYFFKPANKSMWKALLLSLFRVAIMYFRVWILVGFLGKNIFGLTTLTILGFSYMAAMVPIPASLGSHEAIQVFSFQSLGLGISSATIFTMLIRAAEIIFALAGLIILLRIWVGLVKNILLKKVEKLTSKY